MGKFFVANTVEERIIEVVRARQAGGASVTDEMLHTQRRSQVRCSIVLARDIWPILCIDIGGHTCCQGCPACALASVRYLETMHLSDLLQAALVPSAARRRLAFSGVCSSSLYRVCALFSSVLPADEDIRHGWCHQIRSAEPEDAGGANCMVSAAGSLHAPWMRKFSSAF